MIVNFGQIMEQFSCTEDTGYRKTLYIYQAQSQSFSSVGQLFSFSLYTVWVAQPAFCAAQPVVWVARPVVWVEQPVVWVVQQEVGAAQPAV